jgi:glucosamine--fructose-6-phosphate aminotransferase (isomerizing)
MCGIVAYHGPSPALPVLLSGLSRLEYRGYDSVGLALSTADGQQLTIHRAVGRLAALLAVLPDEGTDCSIGIGHTRWATHGAPTESNAHPHLDCGRTVAVVHNGTIDNAAALRTELDAAGHVVTTDVDTEIVAHLIEDQLARRATRDLTQLVAAVRAAIHRLEGSWALAVTAVGVPGVVLARHRSPLLVAETTDALLASSDTLGFSGEVVAVRELKDAEVVTLGADQDLRWYDRRGDRIALPAPLDVPVRHIETDLQGAPDYTSKEINEQPEAARRLIDRLVTHVPNGALLRELELSIPSRVRLVACGSSSYAAQVTAHVLATVCGVPARVITASEHTADPDEPETLTVAFSQSGETADVLAARDTWHGPWLAITNNPYSSLARCSDAVLDLACGPELGVAATKSFTAQVIAGSAFALALGAARAAVGSHQLHQWITTLEGLPDRLAASDALAQPVAAQLAAELADRPGWIYTSRGAGVPYAYEGALKLKELAYRWVEVLPAGELKHGPLALVQVGTPVVLIHAQPTARLAVNACELATRGAHIITVGGPDAVLPAVLPPIEPPWGPVEATVALQHLSREMASTLGHDVDRPRNLAKSVTVE